MFEKVEVINFEDFDEAKFGKEQDVLTVVCVATHYEGDPCDNTAKFHSWIKKLKKDGITSAFTGLQYAVFGLGDSSYENYNAIGRLYDKLFEKLGGVRVLNLAEGNAELLETEEQFEEWKSTLWERLAEYYETLNP